MAACTAQGWHKALRLASSVGWMLRNTFRTIPSALIKNDEDHVLGLILVIDFD